MSTLLGILAGLGLGGIVIWLVPGTAGVALAMGAAALGYIGISALTTPERRLGGQAASLLPNGEAISAKLDEAQGLLRQVGRAQKATKDLQVSTALYSLWQALDKLVKYVQENPSAYRQLSHWMNTYADQLASVLQSWAALETSGDALNIHEGEDDMLLALKGLTTAAEGELGQATDAHVAQIEASQEAIRRLAAMDGYGVGQPAEKGAASARDAGTGEGSNS